MWKDWLFFSRSQRIGILILVTIILILLVVRMVVPTLCKQTSPHDSFESEAALFFDSLKRVSPKSSYRHYENHRYWSSNEKSKAEPVAASYSLFKFNPNTADSLQLIRLGIKPKVASGILKYRKKGGKFRQPDDFRKVWGMDKLLMDRLIAYVEIPPEVKVLPVTAPGKILKTENIIELNSADTLQLQQVKGIGSGFARRIALYRKRLGGFVSVEQLKEVWGISSEMYNSIAPHFTVDRRLVQTINVNKASLEKLKYHPYLNFYSAKAIYELRLSKGRLNSLQELQSASVLSSELVGKIGPYLTF